MTKVSRKPIKSEELGKYLNNLWSAFVLMESKEDIKALFNDLFTPTEHKMFAKRLEIAKRLLADETYENISKIVNVTATTINQISNILAIRGEGFRLAVGRLNEIEREKHLKEVKRLDRLENPIRRKLAGASVLAVALKEGAKSVNKALLTKRKNRSVYRTLHS